MSAMRLARSLARVASLFSRRWRSRWTSSGSVVVIVHDVPRTDKVRSNQRRISPLGRGFSVRVLLGCTRARRKTVRVDPRVAL